MVFHFLWLFGVTKIELWGDKVKNAKQKLCLKQKLQQMSHFMYKAWLPIIQYHQTMYKLYTFARSSTAWRARIALQLKGIQADQIYIHLFKGQQLQTEYKNINPNSAVPTLIIPDGTPLIESMAIIQYINEVHPQPHDLLPGSPGLRAQIRGFCQVINSGIHPYQNIRLLEKLEKDYGAKKTEWLLYWLKRGTSTLEDLVAKHSNQGTYVFGDEITLADVFLYPQIYNAKNRFNLDIEPYPNVSRVFQNLSKLKQFQDSAPQKQKDYE